MTEPTFAFGLLLRLARTDEGGRKTPLAGGYGGEARFRYRPNWGLPGMLPPDQSGAPVLGFDQTEIVPGDTVRVVIVPPFPAIIPEWAKVQPGDDLPMYEGPRVCGHGRVLWRQATELPLPEVDEGCFRRWLAEGNEYSERDR